jgi:hypothetical protein
MTKVEIESYVIKWGGRYALVPRKDKEVLGALVGRRVTVTIVSDVGVHIMDVKISKNPQYGVVIYLPRRLAPTWERLHEKVLKAVIEVGDDGGY